MPIYEYQCHQCHKEFECLVLKSDDDISCPDCNSSKVKRLMSSCRFKSGDSSDSSASSSSGSSSCSGCTASSCAGCH